MSKFSLALFSHPHKDIGIYSIATKVTKFVITTLVLMSAADCFADVDVSKLELNKKYDAVDIYEYFKVHNGAVNSDVFRVSRLPTPTQTGDKFLVRPLFGQGDGQIPGQQCT